MRIYLKVPFREKDLAKAAGAWWDRDRKQWYAPESADLERLAKWIDTGFDEHLTKPKKSSRRQPRQAEVRSIFMGWITGRDYVPTPDPGYPPWEDGSEDIFLTALDNRK